MMPAISNKGIEGLGRLLLADDEDTFLLSTAALLRREGYDVTTVSSGDAAAELVAREPFDLVLADIRMAGNSELQLVRLLGTRDDAPPVILLTGYPSLKTAVPAVHLAVAAYLIKPLDIDLLLRYAHAAVEHSRANRLLLSLTQRAQSWHDELGALNRSRSAPRGGAGETAIEGFTNLTLANISASLDDLRRVIVDSRRGGAAVGTPCLSMNCPRYAILTSAIDDAIDVLEETKRAFKSRALGELKDRLRRVRDEAGGANPAPPGRRRGDGEPEG